MTTYQKPIFARMMPYVGLGIFLVVLAIFSIIFFYVLVIGFIVGAIIFAISYVKVLLSGKMKQPQKDTVKRNTGKTKQVKGDTYEHDEFNK